MEETEMQSKDVQEAIEIINKIEGRTIVQAGHILRDELDRIREEEYRKGYTEGGKDAYSVIKAGSDLNREIKKFNSLTEK